MVDKRALGAIGELYKLGGCANETGVTNGGVGKDGGDGVGLAVSGDGGLGVDAGLVVEDADGDLAGGGCSGDAAGESKDGGGEDGGELHFDGGGLVDEVVGLEEMKCGEVEKWIVVLMMKLLL